MASSPGCERPTGDSLTLSFHTVCRVGGSGASPWTSQLRKALPSECVSQSVSGLSVLGVFKWLFLAKGRKYLALHFIE